MKFSALKMAIVWVLFLMSHTVFADQVLTKQNISIAAYRIQGVLDDRPNATYSSILKEASRRTGIELSVEYLPPNRARTVFDEGLVDCITPIDKDFFPKYGKFYQTNSLNVAKAYVFTLPGHRLRESVGDLEGIAVGAELGIQYGSEIENNVNLVRVRKLISLIGMLQLGRIQAIIAYVPDIYEIFNKLNMKPLPHNIDNPIIIHQEALVCRITPDNKDAIKRLDLEIKVLHENGYIQSVFSEE